MADQTGDATLEQVLMGMAELVALELVEFLDGERYLGIGDAEVIAEMAPIAQGAVSDRINELIESPGRTGWSESMIHMPLQEAFYALQSVRRVGNEPIRNTPPQPPPPAKSGGRRKKRKRKRRGRRRVAQGTQQEKLFHPDEDPNDPDNYEEENDPGGPFYESDGLSARDQAWLAKQSRQDSERRGDYDDGEQLY